MKELFKLERAARLEAGFTLQEVSKCFEITPGYLSNLENGVMEIKGEDLLRQYTEKVTSLFPDIRVDAEPSKMEIVQVSENEEKLRIPEECFLLPWAPEVQITRTAGKTSVSIDQKAVERLSGNHDNYVRFAVFRNRLYLVPGRSPDGDLPLGGFNLSKDVTVTDRCIQKGIEPFLGRYDLQFDEELDAFFVDPAQPERVVSN